MELDARFYVQEKGEDPVLVNLSSNMYVNPDVLKVELSKIDSLTDKELYDLVQAHYNDILDQIFTSKDGDLIDLFTNNRFIMAATQVVYTLELSEVQRRRSNKMAYDYFIIPEEKRDSYTQSLLMGFSKTLNRKQIPLLCGLTLPENIASLLALSRYSSESEIINVKRLNNIMCHQPQDIIDEQMCVNIYLTLFNHMTPLFEGIMLDIQSPDAMNPNMAEVYGNITLAMLDLVNELPLVDIETLLLTFQEHKRMMYPDNSLRINLESCVPSDYPRLFQVIDKMKHEGTYTLYS